MLAAWCHAAPPPPAGVQSSVAKPASRPQPWWASAVIYEIYPRSFQDTNGDGVGDLKGITQRLDYLKRLGVDAIWVTPFFPSPNADFGYDVSDYTNVAPEYGTMEDWDVLVAEARKRGIRVLVDFVLNHSSDQHAWFKESRSSRDNPKRDWYVWRDPRPDGSPPTNWESIFGGSTWEWDEATKQYYYHIFLKQQPDVNWSSPKLKEAMFDVARFWLQHGASGFRLDATPYLFEDQEYPDDPDPKSGRPVHMKPYNSERPEGNAVLRDLRKVVDGFPGEPVLLGESSTMDIAGLRKVYGKHADEVHLPMNFLYGRLNKLDAATFKKAIDDAHLKLDGLPPVFFFSSHDHPRQWSSFGDGIHDDRIARITATMNLTTKGAAIIYYGEEIGMANLPAEELRDVPLSAIRKVKDDRDPSRSPMQWDAGPGAGFSQGKPWLPVAEAARVTNVAVEEKTANSLLKWYQQLIQLRKSLPALKSGAYLPLESGNPKVLAYARKAADGTGVLVLLNMSADPQTAKVAGWPGPAPSMQKVLMASPEVSAHSQYFELAAYGTKLLGFKSR